MASDLISRKELLELYEGLDGQGLKVPVEVVVQNIKDMPTVDRWIPCSERLPEETGRYLLQCKQKAKDETYFTVAHINVWSETHKTWLVDGIPVAWMPLPSPYKAGDIDG